MSWTEIERWIGEKAPALDAALLPPSTAIDIADAEETIGYALPDDVIAWWRRFGGIGETYHHWPLVPDIWQPHGLDRALHFRTLMMQAISGIAFATIGEEKDYEAVALREPAGTPCVDIWLPAWLPVAADGSGHELFVDLRGGPLHGCVMEWGKYSGADGEAVWPGVTAMLDDTLKALRGETAHRLVFERGNFHWE
ncbi:SMI1/KNR4 family protein [Lentzea jiangxiensis]|uniref:SMI1 / KNR4 family (SUKH-1) n=1 Tax=Lentzea jiangxiensis TaxID=641025 RepID=A0A1H0WA45_9PSEU|nr:SMI1/KNR4 family protein [Lentzea jiangxiensis]SDP87498.1 SMI1 / KNR4 family (SUKH-1) [Lentzea jiangxiensis]